MLKAGATATTPTESGATALHFAAASGSAEAVNLLIDAGADVNAKESESGQTPLIFAASTGQVATINALLKRGADPKIATKVVDLAKQSATRPSGAGAPPADPRGDRAAGRTADARARASSHSGDARAADDRQNTRAGGRGGRGGSWWPWRSRRRRWSASR